MMIKLKPGDELNLKMHLVITISKECSYDENELKKLIKYAIKSYFDDIED